jgi:hypothetical protein
MVEGMTSSAGACPSTACFAISAGGLSAQSRVGSDGVVVVLPFGQLSACVSQRGDVPGYLAVPQN